MKHLHLSFSRSFSSHHLLVCALFFYIYGPLHAQISTVQSDTWTCQDALGRKVATYGEGVDRTAVDSTLQVGIFYYLWHGQHGAEIKDIPTLLQKDPVNPAFGAFGQFHWGGKPALGYYTGGDPFIVAKHMQMLVDAGIDFYFFDVTNAFTYDAQVQVVLNEIQRRASLGLQSPKLAFCCHSGSAKVVTHLYQKWYSNTNYDGYWFCWNGKPLILTEKSEWNDVEESIRSHFTMRHSWAWQEGEDCWPWLANYPQKENYSYETGERVAEQMTVATAQHPSGHIGKSYHNGQQPAVDVYGLCDRTPYGDYFNEQFGQALSIRPKVLMITQWNEWMAQRFEIKTETEKNYIRPGANAAIGETYFVDVYNQEFNRDIEPSADPLLLDNYYLQMTSNLRQYRGAHPIPEPTVPKTIQLHGDLSQWDSVQPAFYDEPGDVYYTSASAMRGECLKRPSWDIVRCKVSKDADYYYFMAQVKDGPITFPSDSVQTTFMTLLINADTAYTSGWEGYDFKIQKSGSAYHLYAWNAEKQAWDQRMKVKGVIHQEAMVYQIPRKALSLEADVDFDFKWVDNTPSTMDSVMEFIANGEAAPNGRFNYRYKGSSLITPATKTSSHSSKGRVAAP